MILLAVVITVQARMHAQALTIATLIKSEERELHQRAVMELVGADIIQVILSPETSTARSLDGQPYEFSFEGNSFDVQLQDVAGIVDIYQSGPEQLALLGLDQSKIRSILKWRETSAGVNRFSNLVQTMTVLDLNQELQGLLTQRRQSSRINPNTAPSEIRDHVQELPRTSLRVEQAKTIRVNIIQ